MESWHEITGHASYAVSDFGRIKRLTKGRRTRPGYILKPWIDSYGYPMVTLDNKDILVHRLVAQYFCKGDGPEVNHKDGNKVNCHASNLEFTDRSGNIKHLFAIGLASNSRERNPKAKLNSEQVYKIRELHGKGLSYSLLATKFGVSKSCIAFVIQNRSWKEIENGDSTKV